MDLNCVKLVFNQTGNWFNTRLPVVLMGSLPRPSWSQPSNGVEAIGRLESSAVNHWHCWGEIEAVVGWLISCWVEKWLDDRPTQHRILYQDWTSSIVTNWSCHCPIISCHHCTTWWCVLHPNHYWITPSLSLGICQVGIMLFSSHDPFLLCFIIFSLTLCHMPLFLLIIELIPFPWQHSPFVFDRSFVLMTHFISLTILPIIHTLFDAFLSYCYSIYGLHICGVLSWPHFSYLKLNKVVWLELPSFVTSGYPPPSALIMPKVKSSIILSTLCTHPISFHS